MTLSSILIFGVTFSYTLHVVLDNASYKSTGRGEPILGSWVVFGRKAGIMWGGTRARWERTGSLSHYVMLLNELCKGTASLQ